MYMNQCEIEDAVARIERNQNPVELVKAALFLQAFCDLINAISDGWPYWSYGTKCSQNLQEIVRDGQYPASQVIIEDITPATKKVLTFLKRCKQTKDNPDVIAFVKSWQQYLK